MIMNDVMGCTAGVATGSDHPDYPGHLGHFLSGSKWVSPRHTNMPDPDQIELFSYRTHQKL